jgi:hypothetical protein
MMEIVSWVFPIAWLAIILGVVITLASWIAYDKRKDKRMKEMITSNGSWCSQNCRNYRYCYQTYKDPDDAWKELEEHCSECPMAKAMEMIETEKRRKQK